MPATLYAPAANIRAGLPKGCRLLLIVAENNAGPPTVRNALLRFVGRCEPSAFTTRLCDPLRAGLLPFAECVSRPFFGGFDFSSGPKDEKKKKPQKTNPSHTLNTLFETLSGNGERKRYRTGPNLFSSEGIQNNLLFSTCVFQGGFK